MLFLLECQGRSYIVGVFVTGGGGGGEGGGPGGGGGVIKGGGGGANAGASYGGLGLFSTRKFSNLEASKRYFQYLSWVMYPKNRPQI